MRPIVTRFAPSPTGTLHIGGARTALFNWLFARHHQGKFLLRIEDTDRQRSTPQAIEAILDGLAWLGIDPSEPAQFQSRRRERHAAVAQEMLAAGTAYRCYATPAELEEMRNLARAERRPPRYDGRWRDRSPAEAPPDAPFAIRLRAPLTGELLMGDRVQGEVRVAHQELDDTILLRSDGTPTYLLSVVVDDHDSAITHVIRGDDHLTNGFRQTLIYQALGWTPPEFAHIPLIHGSDGRKLSKRHGASGIAEFREMGYLPAAMRNYLLRLGWAHGDEEKIEDAQAVEWFSLEAVGKSPARLDYDRLAWLNGWYLRERLGEDERLALVLQLLEARTGVPAQAHQRAMLQTLMAELCQRARTLVELADSALFLFERPRPDAKAQQSITQLGEDPLQRMRDRIAEIQPWDHATIEHTLRSLAHDEALKLGQLAQPLRALLTGSLASPGIFAVMETLGQQEVLARLSA